jgi:hypothetical protein
MFSLLDTAAHDKIKAKTAAAYGGKENPGLEGEIDSVLGEMVAKIRTKYTASGKTGVAVPMLDFAKMAQYFTLDSITKLAFGHEFGFLRKEEDIHGYLKMLEEVGPSIVLCMSVPFLAKIASSRLVLSLAGPKPGDKTGIGRILPFVAPFSLFDVPLPLITAV